MARASDSREATAESGEATPGRALHLYQRAFAILGKQISEGMLEAGARLTESAIAAQFGISRAPARQALKELERKGLVERSTGRGYLVAGVASTSEAPRQEAVDEACFRLLSSPSWEPIYAEVEDEIVGRISFASWRVNEAELARHYGVSRTVARDVLGRLQQRGLVLKDERSRWYAPALTPEHVGELYELRAILEPIALQKAAPKLSEVFLELLRERLEAAIEKPETVEGPLLDSLEEDMHVRLLGHCGNRALMEAITMPQSLLIAHRFLYRWTPRLFESEPFLPEHLEIVELLQKGQWEQAAGALERHLYVSQARALARVEAVRSSFQPEGLAFLEKMD